MNNNLEYICFKCFNVHLGKICPKCNPPQPKKKKQPKKNKYYEIVLSNRDEHGEAEDLYHFEVINGKVNIKEAQEIWVRCECNCIEVNQWNEWSLVDQFDWSRAPKYIQKIAKKIMS
tara:strand:- start:119 stop:469 length:351 start_codon:yes stop_codon:yes gene_type:complete